jgi:hypothetical protein
MRVIGEIPHAEFKITLFHWNNRYLIKLEKNLLEQTFKVDQFELSSEKDLHSLIDENFLQKASDRFHEMEQAMADAMQKL